MTASLQNQAIGTRIRNLPIEERIRLYNEAWRLRKEFGYGYHLTGKKLGIPRDVVRHWFHHNRNPYNETFRKQFDETPSPELAYIIGVMFGDGSLTGKYSKNHHGYKIRLRVNSKEFAEIFATKVAKILNTKNYKIGRESYQYRVQVSNHQLYNFLEQPFEKIKPFIEAFPKEFIKGFVDSEGSVVTTICKHKNWIWLQLSMGISNNRLELLKFIQILLSKEFNIKSSLKSSYKKGSRCLFSGKVFKRNKDSYDLKVYRINDIKTFSNVIGFGLPYKQEKLLDAIYILEANTSNSEKVKKWSDIYEKQNNRWVKKNENNINCD